MGRVSAMGSPQDDLDTLLATADIGLMGLMDQYESVEGVYEAATASRTLPTEAANTTSLPRAVLHTTTGVR